MIKDWEKIISEVEKDILTLSKDELKKKYLSKEGIVTNLFKEIKELDSKDRGIYGKELNKVKNLIEEKIKRSEETTVKESNKRIDPIFLI